MARSSEVGKNCGPRVAESPLELLSGHTEEPFINYFWGPVAVGAVAFAAVCFGNWSAKRPIFSGIQKHILFTLTGAAIGKIADDQRRDYFAERDAVLRDYVRLHPEDFPNFIRKKYADVLEPWVPIR